MAYLHNLALFIGYVVLFYLFVSVTAALTIHASLMRPVLKQRNHSVVRVWSSNLFFGFNLLWYFFTCFSLALAIRIMALRSKECHRQLHEDKYFLAELRPSSIWEDTLGNYWSHAYNE